MPKIGTHDTVEKRGYYRGKMCGFLQFSYFTKEKFWGSLFDGESPWVLCLGSAKKCDPVFTGDQALLKLTAVKAGRHAKREERERPIGVVTVRWTH